MRPIMLASASPRRREILTLAGIPFEVEPAADESAPEGLSPVRRVRALARSKAEAVFARHPDRVVLGADTMVELDGEMLGKPHSEDEAVAMLMRLQGRRHRVLTGVWVCSPRGADGFTSAAWVEFYAMSRAEARAYVATGEPMDKAGAYGIQGYGLRFIRGIEGDFFTVMGLPGARVVRFLRRFYEEE